MQRLYNLFARSAATADEPSDAEPLPATDGDVKLEGPATLPGLRKHTKRPFHDYLRGSGGNSSGNVVVEVEPDHHSPTASSTSMRPSTSTSLGQPPPREMRRTTAPSDERRLFPYFDKPGNGVRITPGQTFGTARSGIQKYAFRPVDRISRAGFKDSGPVRASGGAKPTPNQRSPPVPQHSPSSLTLRDDEDRIVKRRRRSSHQIINLVDDDRPSASVSVCDEGSRRVRSPSVVSVGRSPGRNTTRLDNPEVPGQYRQPAKEDGGKVDGNIESKHGDIRSPNPAVGEKRLGSPLPDARKPKSNRVYRDGDFVMTAVKNKRSRYPFDTTDLSSNEEHRDAASSSRRDSDASDSPDELQRDFAVPNAPVTRPNHRKHISIDVPMEIKHQGRATTLNIRRESPSDIPPTVFELSRKTHKGRRQTIKPARSHRHIFDVRFFRHGELELEDQSLQLSLDEESDTLGLLPTDRRDSFERIPVHRVASTVQGSDASLKVRFILCKTEGSPSPFVDVEFGNDHDKARLCGLLERKGVTSKSKSGSWMDKAFKNMPKTTQTRPAPARVKDNTTDAITDFSPEIENEAAEEPVERQKLSASLQNESTTQPGLKQPPRRLPLSLQSQTSFPWEAIRSRSPDKDKGVDVPVKTWKGYATRTKTRQSLVDLIDDDADGENTINSVPSSPPPLFSPNTLKKTLVYPPEGRKKAEVDSYDIDRLRDGEFLNDNLIGFYSRFLEHHLERNKPDVSKRVYFFNSYFYDTLTNAAKGKRGVNYEGVQKWTRNVDLFSHDYVIVPINENAHWYLAIICNLTTLDKKKGEVAPPELEPEPEPEPEHEAQPDPQSVKHVEEIPETPSEREATPEQNARESFASMKISDCLPSSPHKEGHHSEDDWPDKEENQETHPVGFRNGNPSRVSEPSRPKGKKPKRKGAILSVDQPTIITFDSLGAARQPAIKTLRTYLLEEADFKRSLSVDAKDIKGMTAKEIPLQPNFSDCGLYMLAYLEKFVQDPDTFVRKLLQKEMSADDDWPALKSGLLRRRLRNFIFKLQEEQDDHGKAKLVDANPISYLLGSSMSSFDGSERQTQPTSSAGVPDTPQEAASDAHDEVPTAELGETEVVHETQLSQNSKAINETDASKDPRCMDIGSSATAKKHNEKQDDDVVELIEQPETPRSNVTTRSEKAEVDASPRSSRKAKTERSLSVTAPPPGTPSKEPAKPDDIWDEKYDSIGVDPPRKVKMEVQVPLIQVPGTPPSAKKEGKNMRSPRQSKLTRRR